MSINFASAADRINTLRGAARGSVVQEALSQTSLTQADADLISTAADLDTVEGILGAKGTSVSELLDASSQLTGDDVVASGRTGRPGVNPGESA